MRDQLYEDIRVQAVRTLSREPGRSIWLVKRTRDDSFHQTLYSPSLRQLPLTF
jgi:hypothetical protein